MYKWIEYYIINKSGLFDTHYYLKHYPDIRRADIDPLMHYIESGWKEGRTPGPSFDTQFYLESNTDVRQENANPLLHYIRYGQFEGRLPIANSDKTESSRTPQEELIAQLISNRTRHAPNKNQDSWLDEDVLEQISSMLD